MTSLPPEMAETIRQLRNEQSQLETTLASYRRQQYREMTSGLFMQRPSDAPVWEQIDSMVTTGTRTLVWETYRNSTAYDVRVPLGGALQNAIDNVQTALTRYTELFTLHHLRDDPKLNTEYQYLKVIERQLLYVDHIFETYFLSRPDNPPVPKDTSDFVQNLCMTAWEAAAGPSRNMEMQVITNTFAAVRTILSLENSAPNGAALSLRPLGLYQSPAQAEATAVARYQNYWAWRHQQRSAAGQQADVTLMMADVAQRNRQWPQTSSLPWPQTSSQSGPQTSSLQWPQNSSLQWPQNSSQSGPQNSSQSGPQNSSQSWPHNSSHP